MNFDRKLTRRDFSKLCAGSTAALGMTMFNFPEFDKMFATALTEVPVIWVQAGSDSGCSVSIINAFNPTIQDLLLTDVVPGKHINLRWHQTLMASSGELCMEALDKAHARGGYVLVIEGTISTKDNGIYCVIGEKNGKGITSLEHLITLSRDAIAVLALGTCASFGGIPAAKPNVTDIKPVDEILEDEGITTPVINLPGCPAHPDWFVGTVASILIGGLDSVELDSRKRPTAFYGKTNHDQCPRRGQFEAGLFSEKLGEPYCLLKLGCKGPVTYADCSDRLWNNKTRWCVESNAPCAGCAHPGFPDEVSPLYEEPDLTSDVNTAAIGVGAAALAGAGIYGLTRIGKK
jgi:hydrogenase small subunit